MVFSLTLDDRLLQLLGVFDQNGRVLELRVVEQFAEFLLVALFLALDGGAVARFGEDDRLDRYRGGRGREGVVRAGSLQFHGASDVAGRELRHLDAVFAGHGEQL